MAIASSARTTGIPGLKLGPLDRLPRPLAFAAVGAPFFVLAFVIVVIASVVSHHPPTTEADAEGVALDAAASSRTSPNRPRPGRRSRPRKRAGSPRSNSSSRGIPRTTTFKAVLAESAVVAAQKPETTEDAFAILENELGARGVDGLLELATSPTVPRNIRLRATKASSSDPEIRSKATPAANVVLDLRAAQTCTARHELLERAKESGDARALALLKPMKNTRGCGFLGRSDCNGCLRRDTDLEDAIGAIEARAATAPKPASRNVLDARA